MLINPKHRDNAFDLIRFLAALAVLYSHSFPTSGLLEPRYFGGETAGSIGVFVFFAVSGYLVQQSWDRTPNPGLFALSRALRIFPGLLVCLLLCAAIFGPIVTKFTLSSYFSDPNLYKFIYSNMAMLFIPRYDALPGVFVDNVFPKNVNSSLWTIRFEVFMYITLLTVSVFFRKSSVIIAGLLLGLCGLYVYGMAIGLKEPGVLLWRLGVLGLDGRILKLAPFFLVGVLIAKAPTRFLSIPVALFAFVITSLAYNSPGAIVILWFTLPYCLIVLAYSLPTQLNKFGRHGDFSYGLYLYAFPIQQVLAQLTIATTNWWAGFLTTVVVALTFAILSWKYVEAPATRLRSTLVFRNSKA